MSFKDRASMDKQDLRHMDEAGLAQLGILRVDAGDLVLECRNCGERWEPQLDAAGKLPYDFWICPARCNAGAQPTERTRSAGR